MKRILCLTLASALLSFATVGRAAEPGYVDLGKISPAEGCQFVEVNLHAPLLKFASVFVDKEEPEAAALIRSLKHVRVNVVGFNDETRGDTTDRVRSIRKELATQGWTQVVTVQESGKAEDVGVFMKLNDRDEIDGVVVTVIDREGNQAVFVNVVGNIKPEQIAALGERLDVPPLAELKFQPRRTGKGA
jgi:hypothetical protein